MHCEKCDHPIHHCICSDIDKRMREATDSPHVAMRWCKECDLVYHRCICPTMENHAVRSDGKFYPLPDGDYLDHVEKS